jgi:glycosyltransferase involved in cell wall biosynthesis
MVNTAWLVTIVIPVYNGARYLRETIDSVLEQDYPHIELIVLDDGSTDETIGILEGYKDQFYWETQPNLGQARTLNKGWQMSHGEVLGYLSADDSLLPTAVRKSVECLLEDEERVLAYCDYYLIDEQSRVIGRVSAPEIEYRDMVAKVVCPPGPGAFFRRVGFEKTGVWNPNLKQVPDYDYWIRLGLHGKFSKIQEPLAKFRIHEDSQSYAEPDEERSDEILDVMKRYFLLAGIPKTVLAHERQAFSSAHIVAARFHLRAGRYGLAVSRMRQAVLLNPLRVFSREALKYMGNGLAYRMKRATKGIGENLLGKGFRRRSH